jgi:hypothetical protein
MTGSLTIPASKDQPAPNRFVRQQSMAILVSSAKINCFHLPKIVSNLNLQQVSQQAFVAFVGVLHLWTAVNSTRALLSKNSKFN